MPRGALIDRDANDYLRWILYDGVLARHHDRKPDVWFDKLVPVLFYPLGRLYSAE